MLLVFSAVILAAPHRRGNAMEAPHKAGGLEARFEQMERSFTDRILELEKVNEEQQLVIDKFMMSKDAVRRAPLCALRCLPHTLTHALSWLAPRRRRSLPWSVAEKQNSP